MIVIATAVVHEISHHHIISIGILSIKFTLLGPFDQLTMGGSFCNSIKRCNVIVLRHRYGHISYSSMVLKYHQQQPQQMRTMRHNHNQQVRLSEDYNNNNSTTSFAV